MDLTQEDLITTSESIIEICGRKEKQDEFKKSQNFKKVSRLFSLSYKKFRHKQETEFVHPNFHTLRDFYWEIKIFADTFYKGKCKEDELPKYIKEAIDTNFSGLYKKEARNSEATLNKSQQTQLENIDQMMDETKQTNLRSNFLMMRLFEKCLKDEFPGNPWNMEAVAKKDSSVFDHIRKGVLKDCRRYLMLFVDYEITSDLLFRKLNRYFAAPLSNP